MGTIQTRRDPAAAQRLKQIIDGVEQAAWPIAPQDEAVFVGGAHKAVASGAVAQRDTRASGGGAYGQIGRAQQD
jgi:hypothetical protein